MIVCTWQKKKLSHCKGNRFLEDQQGAVGAVEDPGLLYSLGSLPEAQESTHFTQELEYFQVCEII